MTSDYDATSVAPSMDSFEVTSRCSSISSGLSERYGIRGDRRDVELFDVLYGDGRTRGLLANDSLVEICESLIPSLDVDGIACKWSWTVVPLPDGFSKRNNQMFVTQDGGTAVVRGYFTRFEAFLLLVVPVRGHWIAPSGMDAISCAWRRICGDYTETLQGVMFQRMNIVHKKCLLAFMDSLRLERSDNGSLFWTGCIDSKNVSSHELYEIAEPRLAAAYHMAANAGKSEWCVRSFPVFNMKYPKGDQADMHLVDGCYQYVPRGQEPVTVNALFALMNDVNETIESVCSALKELKTICKVTAAVHRDHITASFGRRSIGQLHFNITINNNNDIKLVSITVRSGERLTLEMIRKIKKPRSRWKGKRKSERRSQRRRRRSELNAVVQWR